MIKQCQFSGIKDGQIFVQPILFSHELEKRAEVAEMRSKLHPKIKDFVSAIRPTSSGIYILVNALGASEYFGSNSNGDAFAEKALIHAPSDWDELLDYPERAREVGKAWAYGYPTFMGASPFKHHINSDSSRAFGKVELATWNPKMHRVELVIYLDRALCKKFDALDVLDRIENGEYSDISMGCKVPYDRCSICQHKSKTVNDYCIHAKTMMNKILPDGRKVMVYNDFPRFFDISFVFIGADKTAKVMAKLAQKGNQVCLGDFCTVPRLSAEVGAAFTKTADPVDELPHNNGYSKERAIEEAGQKAIKLAPASQRWRTMKEVANDGPADEPDKIDQARTVLVKNANDPIKKKINFNGVPVWIEWLKGETREYKKDGKIKYQRLMAADYGYIPGTMDSDGEELDVYVGPDKSATNAYVIRQLKKTGSFDEHKVMIGYASKSEAKASYVHHMGGTPERFGGIQSIPLNSLVALFGDNKKSKEKTACSCHGIGDDCGGSIEKLGELLFPVSKSASHAKLSEIIKNIPAGPFSKETLPKLEKIEKDIPNEILDIMGNLSLGSALSTPTMAGMILKPREFQRIILINIGEKPLADELDSKKMTFNQTKDTDDSIPIDEGLVNSSIMGILNSLGLIKDRSAADSSLKKRSIAVKDANANSASSKKNKSNEPVMKKIAAAYQGYRYNVLRKAASISNYMTNNSQLRSELFGSSMAQAFAGGIEKVSSASVLSPDSLAYLIGAYTDRDQLLTNEIVTSLALTGTVSEIA